MQRVQLEIPTGPTVLPGELTVPENPTGVILFAHGSGSSRLSPRNRKVASMLNQHGFGTVLFDLLSAREERQDILSGELRFNIELLADRLGQATDWMKTNPLVGNLPFAYFGASTGAAAALTASIERSEIRAIVSRGGRPDMASNHLLHVQAPVLLIVGGADYPVIEMNQSALHALPDIPKELRIVPGATHLFEEPGALERVAEMAIGWFSKHIAVPRDQPVHTHA